jgi:hypothetical protein
VLLLLTYHILEPKPPLKVQPGEVKSGELSFCFVSE